VLSVHDLSETLDVTPAGHTIYEDLKISADFHTMSSSPVLRMAIPPPARLRALAACAGRG